MNRDAVLADVQRLLSKSPFTKEDSSRAERLMQLADSLSPAMDELRRLRLSEHAVSMAEIDPAHAAQYRLTPGVRALNAVENAFDTCLRYGREHVPEETRALSTLGSSGGYTVAQSFGDRFWANMAAYDNLFHVATIVTSNSGNGPMPFPLVDDTTAAATKVPENNQVTPADFGAFGSLTLDEPETWRTNMQQVSMELADDSAFDISGFLADRFAIRWTCEQHMRKSLSWRYGR